MSWLLGCRGEKQANKWLNTAASVDCDCSPVRLFALAAVLSVNCHRQVHVHVPVFVFDVSVVVCVVNQ